MEKIVGISLGTGEGSVLYKTKEFNDNYENIAHRKYDARNIEQKHKDNNHYFLIILEDDYFVNIPLKQSTQIFVKTI